jgi:hypothetical protein
MGRRLLPLLIAAALPAVAPPAASVQGTRFLARFSDWGLYAHDSPQTKTCFLLAAPKSSEPAAARRDSIFFYISAWPREGVRSEVSVKIGYPFRKGTDATVTVDGESFKLFTREERAFVADATEEQKLVEALRKGSSMVVQGLSERGTTTRDTYSLAGTTQALQALGSSCN